MKVGCPSAVIIAPPGRLRESLRVLLEAGQWITVAGEADDCLTGLPMIRERVPTLVVLDLHEDCGAIKRALDQVKAEWPRLPCFVVAHSQGQEGKARAAGADAVLQAGFSAGEFSQAIAEIADREVEVSSDTG